MMKYFETVRALMQRSGKVPLSIDMENIIREINEEETKERDYVKLRYCLPEQTLYNDTMLNAELKRLQEQPEAVVLPDIPGVNTVAGRMVLNLLKQNVQHQAKAIMDELIQANEETRQQVRSDRRGSVFMSQEGRTVRCPMCKQETTWRENPYRPFCSERCRLADLEGWLAGRYVVASDPEESATPQPNRSRRRAARH